MSTGHTGDGERARVGIAPHDVTAGQFARIAGGRWTRTYASRKVNGRYLFVFRRDDDPADLRVLDSEARVSAARALHFPAIGTLHLSSYLDDPALAGLAERLREYVDVKVLRYRPNKRVTLAARDAHGRPLIVKCVAGGVGAAHAHLEELRRTAPELRFGVSRALWRDATGTLFAQERLPGEPVRLDATPSGIAVARALGEALATLHGSSARFDGCFTLAAQQARSARYVRILERGRTRVAARARRLLRRLAHLEQELPARPGPEWPLVPIHGSPHSGQWLRDGESLSLIDFDRASMGERELDVATFLAEWDYEDPAIGEPVNAAFLGAFANLEPCRLGLYRAHKHLAKAFKAASSTAPDAQAKALRNFERAARITASVESSSA